MTGKFLAIGLVLTFAAILYAQDKKTVTLNGYLLDNMCASMHVNDKDFAERVKKHPTSCALMPNCAKSGFALFSDGKLYKLDEAGNKSAEEVLKNTKKKNSVEVAVEGTLEGDTLHVTKLAEKTGE